MPSLVLPSWAEVGLSIAVIVAVAAATIVAIRLGARVSTRHLLERRVAEVDPSVLPPVELERRVTTVERLLVRVLAIAVAAIAALMILDQFGIDIGPAVAGIGVVGIAVGLGAQTLVKDWLAGIFVVLENQYSRGDHVRLAGIEGRVEDFSLRRTTLRDPDGTVHTVPNGQITVASNLSRASETTTRVSAAPTQTRRRRRQPSPPAAGPGGRS